jgi:hypothetical protein
MIQVAHSFEIKAEITGGVGQPVQPMLWNWGHRLQRLIEFDDPLRPKESRRDSGYPCSPNTISK